MSADLTPAQAARLDAIEAAPFAEEAVVERVARAICDAAYYSEPTGSVWEWVEREGIGDDYRRLAVAAIDVMRGATDDGAIRRVLRLADELDDVANDYWHAAPGSHDAGARNAHHAIARLVRAAIGAPATAEGDDRG